MTGNPIAETLFERFCYTNGISWQRVPVGKARTPDYLVSLNGESVHFEIKQIDADPDFRTPSGVGSRTVGSHVRQKIVDARKQIQAGARAGTPSVLLIYNNLDPLQLFGTETHDFLSAMYGEMTVLLKGNKIEDSFYGQNSLLREEHNTSFSAVGHLSNSSVGPRVRLYENVFARNSIGFALLPECIEVVRIKVGEDAA